jgi:hypothetical protein
MKKLLSKVLIFIMMVSLMLPSGLPVYAGEVVSYIFDVSEGNITVEEGARGPGFLKLTYGASKVIDDIVNTQEITIKGTTTANKVLVDGVTANITLDGVNIELLSTDSNNAFTLKNSANVTLTLTVSNILKGTANGAGGLTLGSTEILTIKGAGDLTASANTNAAGIGGSSFPAGHEANGTINILSGTIVATGGSSGAGIGGTNGGNGGVINISGGTITATGGSGAGIGGGTFGSGGTINISLGTVIATGGSNSAGIGGGIGSDGGIINISGGIVTSTGNKNGAGIGGGWNNSAGTINITGGIITASGSKAISSSFGGTGIGSGCNNEGTLDTSGSITIGSGATVKASAYGDISAIQQGVSGSITAKILMANFATPITANTKTGVYIKSTNSLYTSFEPSVDYQSIAFTVETNDIFQLKTTEAVILQQQDDDPITDFTITTNGIKLFTGVTDELVSSMSSFEPLTIRLMGDIESNNVQYSDAAAVSAGLPDRVAVALNNNRIVDVPVTWIDTDTYNAGSPGIYKFTASWGTLPDGVNNDRILSAPVVKLIVASRPRWTDAGNYDVTLYNQITSNDFLETEIIIRTAAQLAAVAVAVNEKGMNMAGITIKLANDIDLSKYLWEPIGNSEDNYLRGAFDGNGQTISNMTITVGYDAVGLFGMASGAGISGHSIWDLTLTGTISVDGSSYVGGIVGIGSQLTVENCHVNMTIISSSDIKSDVLSNSVGGIVGVGLGMRINNCTTQLGMSITALSPEQSAGGIAGKLFVSGINNTLNSAAIICNGSVAAAGGIYGIGVSGFVNNSYNTGTVTAIGDTSIAGGISAYTILSDRENPVSLIRNCYNTGLITAPTNGGISGYIDSDIENSYYLDSTASYAYNNNEGTVEGLHLTSSQMQATDLKLPLDSWVVNNTSLMIDFDKQLGELAFRIDKIGEITTTMNTWVQVPGVNDGYPIFSTDARIISESSDCDVINWINPSSPTIDTQLITKTVSNATTQLMIEVLVSENASWKVYRDIECTNEITDKIMNFSVGVNTAYLKVTAEDNITLKIYTLNITRQAAASNGNRNTTPSINASIMVNGQRIVAGTTADTMEDGKTITTIIIDKKKLDETMKIEGKNALVIIPIQSGSNTAIGEFNGRIVKDLELQLATLKIQTETGTYTVPTSEINIDAVSAKLGQNLKLGDIKVQIRISEPLDATVSVVQNAATSEAFSIVVPAIEYSISATYKDQTVEVRTFNGYVERTIAIPDGVDSRKITTGIVVKPDGSTYHVPTKVTIINGKYYAVINSLTNSTYTVIWHPMEFSDVTTHWAKDAINDMGARMIVNGTDGLNYEPDLGVTRAEFTAIVIRSLGLEAGLGENKFIDVDTNDWYCDYVETAISYGIITGYDDVTFGPNDKITREQAMIITTRAMKITGLDATFNDDELSSLLAAYKDSSSVASYATTGVAACLKTGIVTGIGNSTIAPKQNITRGEVAVIVQRLLQKSKLI